MTHPMAEQAQEEGEQQQQLRTADGLFSLELCRRNSYLGELGVKLPNARKTGTTIVGALFKDGVILGADTRATIGSIVTTKRCKKISCIAPNIYCGGAGTAADTFAVTNMVSSQLELHRYATGRQSRVITALSALKRHLFNYQGYVEAALILGGVDLRGPHLHNIFPHGSTDDLPYTTMGSGSMAAMAVLDAKFKEDLSRGECEKLVAEAVKAGIFNDLGSGSNVDLCVITKEGAEYIRAYEQPTPRTFRATGVYSFPPGTTEVLKTVEHLRSKLVVSGGDAMEE